MCNAHEFLLELFWHKTKREAFFYGWSSSAAGEWRIRSVLVVPMLLLPQLGVPNSGLLLLLLFSSG